MKGKFGGIRELAFGESKMDYSPMRLLPIIFLIKFALFVFYAACYHLYPEVSVGHGFLYVKGGDTFTYYPPLVSWLENGTYGLICRMPGLALPFLPILILVQNQELAFEFVIVFQFVLSSLSVYVLGLISNLMFNNNKRIFLTTVLLYSLWYHIGDHFLMADSIANSTLIIATYYFLKSLKGNFVEKSDILYSGLFMTWSIFTRLIAIVPFLLLCIFIVGYILIKVKNARMVIISLLLFAGPFFVCESAWVIRNQLVHGRLVLFAEPEECFSSFSYNWRELNKIPTAWGYETTHWVGEIDWLLDNESDAETFPFPESTFTNSFNKDSLVKLKNRYWELKKSAPLLPDVEFERQVASYLIEYRSEEPLLYYFFNPLKLLWKFFYKKTIVDFPFPKLSEMNLSQKLFKGLNWLMLLVLSLVFLLLSPLSFFFNRNAKYLVFLLIPFSISLFLVFFGAIEQRYFWPVVPFCVVYFTYFLDSLIDKTKS